MKPRKPRTPTAVPAALLTGLAAMSVGVAGIAPAAADEGPQPTASSTPAGTAQGAAAVTATPAESHQLTLLTGDRVTLRRYADGRQAAEVDPVDPRAGFRTVEAGGHLSLIPASAQPYLAAGRLDPRLFDLTALAAADYDDAHSAELPLILTYPRGRMARQPVVEGPSRALPSIDGMAVAAPKDRLTGLWERLDVAPGGRALGAGVDRVWLDAPVRTTLDQSVPMINAPAAWASGLDGHGVRVAVLDTGYDPTHPDLAGAVVAAENFDTTSTGTVDRNGHGTHVASTIAGTGRASSGRYKGVAPGATLLVGKILTDSGAGASSWAIAGMEWAVAQGAQVVNMSIGSDPSAGDDPMSLALNRLSASSGALFVVAAGNEGPHAQSVSSPGTADAALTVGNVTKAGDLNLTSGRGPRFGDLAVKPDVTAPGSEIVAARAANTFLGRPVDTRYAALSGTSMATPHVAGAAALLAQQHPDWDAATLKAALTTTANPRPDLSVYEQGAGLVDVGRATHDTVTASVGTLSFGRFDWPHDGDDPVTRPVTYRNSGTEPVSVDLAVDVRSDQGQAAGGAVAVSESTFDLPAGGEHTVTVSVDPDDVAGVGVFGGALTATVHGTDGAGGVGAAETFALRTSLGFAKDEQTYELTVRTTARDGRPGKSPTSVDVFRMQTGDFLDAFVPANSTDGTVRFHVPAGDYAVMGFVFTYDEPEKEEIEETLVGTPELHVDRDMTIDLDARAATPVTVDVGRDVDPLLQSLTWHRTNGKDAFTSSFKPPTTVRRLSATPTAAVRDGEFEVYGKWELVAPRVRMRLGGRVLDPYLLFASAPVQGTRRLSVFDAGTGTPSELEGVEGRLALVRPSVDVKPSVQVANAQDAGAVGLLLANDVPGVLDPSGGSNVRIPVIGLSKVDGDAIRAALPRATVTLSGTDPARTPYLYDLVVPWQGRIPATLGTRITSGEVATLVTDYSASHDEQPGREIRHHWRPWSSSSTAFARDVMLPQRRTEYVSASDSVWQQTVRNAPPFGGELVETTRGYRPGSVLPRSWYRGPIAAGPQAGAIVRPERGVPVNRRENTLFVSMPAFRDSDPTHAGDAQGFVGDTSAARITRDGAVIYEGQALSGQFLVPPAEATYTFGLDVSRGGDFWRTSTRSHTRWTVHSGQPDGFDPVALPFVDARVQVPVDRFNATPAGVHVPVAVTTGHQQGAVESPIRTVTLSVSFDDGVTWRDVRLHPVGGGRYAGGVDNPRTAGFATLRVTATDAAGNAVEQTITRAYEIR